MPLDAKPLSDLQIASIRQWIITGAQIPKEIENRSLASLPKQFKPIQAPERYSAPIPISSLSLDLSAKTVFVSGYGEVTQWELATGQLLNRIPVSGELVADIETSLDGKLLAISSGTPGVNGVVQIMTLTANVDRRSSEEPRVLWTEICGDVAADIAFSPDASRLAIAQFDGGMVIVDLARSSDAKVRSQRLVPHADAILAIGWSTSGDRLITGSRDRTAKIFDTNRMDLIANYDKHQRSVGGVAYLGEHPASFDETGQLRLWNGDDSDKTIAERDNLARFLQHVLVVDKTLYLVDAADVRRFEIERTTVESGKDDEGKSKAKTVVRFNENDRLISGSNSWIMSLAGNSSLIVAGTDEGEVIAWQTNGTAHPTRRFLAKP